MIFEFLGGALEVGGSAIFLNIDGKNILLDSGIRQSSTKDSIPNFRKIQEYLGIDAIIISHAHLDHIGCLPLISKEYPNTRIYMNNMTKELTRVLLYDSIKIMNNREGEIPLYAEKDVEDTLNRIFTVNYENRFRLFDNVYMTFYSAGHIAGASAIYIEANEGSVFYSGDFSIFSQRTVDGARIPKLRSDVAIVESTYGDRLHSNRQIEEDSLVDIVKECIQNKGKMIIPAFALGRAQEVLLILKSAIRKGQLPKVNIYVDGMVRDINRVYKNNPTYLRKSLGKKALRGQELFYDENIKEVSNTDNRDEILAKDESVIIVASSGMLTGGPSASYAEQIAPLENGYIVITGYQDEEAPGRKILDLLESRDEEKFIKLNTTNIPVRCKVKKIGLSAHGDKSEIKGLVERLAPKNLFLVHGEETIVEGLASELADSDVAIKYRRRVYAPKCGETYEINIRNPRKQYNKEIPYIMKPGLQGNEPDIFELWKFMNEKYMDKLFIIEDIIYIWTGMRLYDTTEISKYQKLINDSIYFEFDNRRLFLFKARTKEDVEKDLKEKEITVQELEEKIQELFKNYNYKKISYITEKKEIILNFDFPAAVSNDIFSVIDEFNNDNTWKLTINNTTNLNALDLCLQDLLGQYDITKISHFIDKFKVKVKCSQPIENAQEISEELKRLTGFELINEEIGVNGASNKENIEMIQTNSTDKIEQNEALYYIDAAFQYEKHKPYKKSIKGANSDKYIECAFITPVIGKKYTQILKGVADSSGWNIVISDKVNQNELIKYITKLCHDNGITLKKNPSYNSSEVSITIKITETNDNIDMIKDEFENSTGCKLKIEVTM